jgi:hypothetical protein
MSPIQFVLIAGIVLISVYMYRRRHTVFDGVLVVLFMATGVFFVIYPEITNKLAHLVGVKRGANLVFYTGFLFLFFLVIKLYSRSKRLEQQLTELIRQMSIDKAEDLSG